MARRSVLFTPGDEKEMMRKAVGSDADVVVFDLEDAVGTGSKGEAREGVVEVLGEPDGEGTEVWVRVNPLSKGGRKDIRALGNAGETADGIVVPKLGSSDDVADVADEFSDEGTEPRLVPIVETAEGVLNSQEIAQEEHVDAVIFGAEDLSADIGATRTDEGTEVLYAREKVVTAASAADVDAIDTLHTDFEDDEGLRDDTEFGIQLGYDGKLAIHPKQVAVINEAFTPDDDEVEWARKVLDAAKENEGVFEVEGEMIDSPLVRQAERVRERAEAAGIDF